MEFNKETVLEARKTLQSFMGLRGHIHPEQDTRLVQLDEFLKAAAEHAAREKTVDGTIEALHVAWQKWKGELDRAVTALMETPKVVPLQKTSSDAKMIVVDDPHKAWVVRASPNLSANYKDMFVKVSDLLNRPESWKWSDTPTRFATREEAVKLVAHFHADNYEAHVLANLEDRQNNWVVRRGEKGKYSFLSNEDEKLWRWTILPAHVKFFTYEEAYRASKEFTSSPVEVVKTPFAPKEEPKVENAKRYVISCTTGTTDSEARKVYWSKGTSWVPMVNQGGAVFANEDGATIMAKALLEKNQVPWGFGMPKVEEYKA